MFNVKSLVHKFLSLKHNWFYYLCIAFAFLLPLFQKILPVVIVCMLLTWFMQGSVLKKKIINAIKDPKVYLFMAFYAMHIVGMFYSENLSFGFKDLEIKLSFLLFPLLFSTSDKINTKEILTAFIIGCFVSSLTCIFRALYLYFYLNTAAFSYTDFSFLVHPSYFALYLNFAVIYLLLSNFSIDSVSKQPIYSFVTYGLIGLFSIVIFLLSSKMGIVSLAISFVVAHIYLLKRKNYYRFFVHSVVVVIAFSFSINYVLQHTRLSEVASEFKKVQFEEINASETDSVAKSKVNYRTTESTQIRYLIWHEATQLIKQNWLLGVGTGDIKDQLLERYWLKRMDWVWVQKLNAHNQFIQTTVALGVFGLVLLLSCFFVAFKHGFQKRLTIYLLLTTCFVFHFMVESMLEKQAGVIFYTFFNGIFLAKLSDDREGLF